MCYLHSFFVCWGLFLTPWNGGRLYFFWHVKFLFGELIQKCIVYFKLEFWFLSWICFSFIGFFFVIMSWFSQHLPECFWIKGWIFVSNDISCFLKWSVLKHFLVSVLVLLGVNKWLITLVLLTFLFVPEVTAFA